MKIMNMPVLIPAYNPDDTLLSLVEGLMNQGFKQIIIVNDGSNTGCNYIFEKLGEEEGSATHSKSRQRPGVKRRFRHTGKTRPPVKITLKRHFLYSATISPASSVRDMFLHRNRIL